MDIWTYIVAFLMWLVMLGILSIPAENKAESVIKYIFGSGVTFVLLWALSYDYRVSHPQAIDVYRGNTTLRITYEDSIPIDTIVVFKNK